VRVGRQIAEFEKTTLGELRKWAGAATMEQDGDAGSSRSWLCYSLPGQLVWFISTEMGGDEQALMQLFGEAIQDGDPRVDKCPRLPPTMQPIALEFGWVGSSEAKIRAVLGPPSGVRRDWSQYLYTGKQRGRLQVKAAGKTESTDLDFKVIAFVEMKFRHGKAIAVRASHVTAN
jgi:hypothetical protein